MSYFPRLRAGMFLALLSSAERILDQRHKDLLIHAAHHLRNSLFGPARLYRLRHQVVVAFKAVQARLTDPALERGQRFHEQIEKAVIEFISREGGQPPLALESSFWTLTEHFSAAYRKLVVPLLPKLERPPDYLETYSAAVKRELAGLDPEQGPILIEVCRSLARIHAFIEQKLEKRALTLFGDNLPESEWPAHVLTQFFGSGCIELVIEVG